MANYFAVLIFTIVTGNCRAFVLSNVSTAQLTSYEFRHLFDLILDGQSRITGLEHELKATKVGHDRDVQYLETELNSNRQTVSLLNTTLQKLSKEINYARFEMDKEKANRQQLEHEYTTLMIRFQNLSLELEDERIRTGYRSGFTVNHPAAGTSNDTLSFTNVLSNVGGHFNAARGQYICPFDGIYLFTLNLYNKGTTTSAYCRIEKNGLWLVAATTHMYAVRTELKGYQEATNSVVVRLIKGDVIRLGHCGAVSNMYSGSSFTGVLLQAD